MVDVRSKIVLADDHPIVLSGLKAILSGLPEVDIVAMAPNGAEATTAIRELEPEIAILDINMPEFTGLEILEMVEAEGLSTRVVFLTSSATDAQIAESVRRGAWGIVLKESAADTLVACIQQVSGGNRWLPPDLVEPALRREIERTRKGGLSALTARERELARLVAQGLSNKHIARHLQISEGTVKIHLHNIFQKLELSNRTSLATLTHEQLGQL